MRLRIPLSVGRVHTHVGEEGVRMSWPDRWNELIRPGNPPDDPLGKVLALVALILV